MNEEKMVVHRRRYGGGESVIFSVRMPKELVRRLEEVATETGRSRNELIMMSVEFALDNMEITD